VHLFHNDAGYLEWLAKHPEGFVINTYATPSPGYVRLHHASCPSISRLQPGATTFTDGQYSKICGRRWAGGAGGTCPPPWRASPALPTLPLIAVRFLCPAQGRDLEVRLCDARRP
jgi:hypothetical protein